MLKTHLRLFCITLFYRPTLPATILVVFASGCGSQISHHSDGTLDSSYHNANITYILGNNAVLHANAHLNPYARHNMLFQSDTITVSTETGPYIRDSSEAGIGAYRPSLYSPISVDSGEKIELYLEDASSVLLNSRSVLHHCQYIDRGIRKNLLQGAGIFHIKPGKNKFEVSTIDPLFAEISTDSGTFFISAYNEDSIFKIASQTSRITVGSKVLLPGRCFILDRKTGNPMTETDADPSLFSPDNIPDMIFNQATRLEFGNTIARWYGLNVVFLDSSIYQPLTGTLATDSLNVIKKELATQGAKIFIKRDT